MESNAISAEAPQVLTFSLRGGDYALPVLRVKEILQYEPLTAVPGAPAHVRGVLNLRGSVVPVVDLARKLGFDPAEPTARTCILVVETHADGLPEVIGVLADAVKEVTGVRDDEVEPPPSFGRDASVSFLAGMLRAGTQFVLLLDIDRVLGADARELAWAADALSDGRASGVPA